MLGPPTGGKRWRMYSGQLVLSQLFEFLPKHEFAKCVARYEGNRRARRFRCWDQFLVMAYAQLTFCESLRGIETCLRARPHKLYHAGIKGSVARSTLAEANENRDWRIWADFAAVLIAEARRLHADEPFGTRLKAKVYVFDTTTIDLCLTLFPWAQFRRHKSAVKMHTLLDLRGSIPANVYVTSGAVHDVRILDQLLPEAGAFYLLDRGYLDFARLYLFKQSCAFFITRAKHNTQFWRRDWRPVRPSSGVRSDQTIQLTG